MTSPGVSLDSSDYRKLFESADFSDGIPPSFPLESLFLDSLDHCSTLQLLDELSRKTAGNPPLPLHSSSGTTLLTHLLWTQYPIKLYKMLKQLGMNPCIPPAGRNARTWSPTEFVPLELCLSYGPEITSLKNLERIIKADLGGEPLERFDDFAAVEGMQIRGIFVLQNSSIETAEMEDSHFAVTEGSVLIDFGRTHLIIRAETLSNGVCGMDCCCDAVFPTVPNERIDYLFPDLIGEVAAGIMTDNNGDWSYENPLGINYALLLVAKNGNAMRIHCGVREGKAVLLLESAFCSEEHLNWTKGNLCGFRLTGLYSSFPIDSEASADEFKLVLPYGGRVRLTLAGETICRSMEIEAYEMGLITYQCLREFEDADEVPLDPRVLPDLTLSLLPLKGSRISGFENHVGEGDGEDRMVLRFDCGVSLVIATAADNADQNAA